MIISGSWILPLILSIPHFLKTDFKTETNIYQCLYDWPEDWMNTAYTWTTNSIILLSIVLMAGLYTRMVYTLWLKRGDEYILTNQQQVRDSPNSLGFNACAQYWNATWYLIAWFVITTISLWNSLDSSLKPFRTVRIFKQSLRSKRNVWDITPSFLFYCIP